MTSESLGNKKKTKELFFAHGFMILHIPFTTNNLQTVE